MRIQIGSKFQLPSGLFEVADIKINAQDGIVAYFDSIHLYDAAGESISLLSLQNLVFDDKAKEVF